MPYSGYQFSVFDQNVLVCRQNHDMVQIKGSLLVTKYAKLIRIIALLQCVSGSGEATNRMRFEDELRMISCIYSVMADIIQNNDEVDDFVTLFQRLQRKIPPSQERTKS